MLVRELLEHKKGTKAVTYNKKAKDPAKHFAKAKEKLEPIKPMESTGDKGISEAYDPWDEADVWYRYDSSEGKLKQRSFYHAQERDARAGGYRQSPEQAMRDHGYFPSKFKRGEFVKKSTDGKWIKVYPYTRKDDIKETASPGATSSGNVATLGMNPKLSPGPARGKKSYTGTPGQSGTKAPPQPKVKQPKTKYGTAMNALDMKSNIFGGGAIKRK